MDYEKAYKKALETARDFLDFYKDNPIQAQKFIDIFPELAESEDERIMKHIRSYILSHPDSWGEFDRDTLIHWLEKQKEQKHPNGCFTCDEYKKGYEAGRFHGFTAGYNKAKKEQKPVQTEEEREYVKTLKGLVSDFVRDCGGGIIDVGYYQRISDWLDGRHIEQKPDIEICPHSIKSKSYKENSYPIENCDYGLEIAENILEKTLGKVEGYQSDDGIREHQTAIQAVKDAIKEQKPADLGVKGRRGRIGVTPEPIRKKAEAFLATMEPPYDADDICSAYEIGAAENVKPAEWSEEDEKMLSLIIGEIEAIKVQASTQFEKTIADEKIDWLKSLRPSWKPSEEQMDALRVTLDYMPDTFKPRCTLATLQNDLKKL